MRLSEEADDGCGRINHGKSIYGPTMSRDFRSRVDEAPPPQVSIGLPVFNGQAVICNALDSLLAQTSNDFELIVSDNASTDSTSEICQKYAARDRRVRYVRQPHNIGMYHNFRYVLRQARGDYFMWAAADDWWHPEFIERNYQVLSKNANLVSSISKVKMGNLSEHTTRVGTHPIRGSYPERVHRFLAAPGANSRFYGLFRRQQLADAFVDGLFYAQDWAVMINLLRWGEFYELDEVLMERGIQGESAASLIIEQARSLSPRPSRAVLPLLDFTQWLWSNLDRSVYWKSLAPILYLNVHTELLVLAELLSVKRRRRAPPSYRLTNYRPRRVKGMREAD